jgi:hypothetical protein
MQAQRVLTVAERIEPILCEKGMRVIPEFSYRDVPALALMLVPPMAE